MHVFGAGGGGRTRLFQFGRLTCNHKHFTRMTGAQPLLNYLPRPAAFMIFCGGGACTFIACCFCCACI